MELTNPITVSPAATAILAQSLAWDNHGCMPLRPDDVSFLPQLQRYRVGGFHVATLNAGFDALPWFMSVQLLALFRNWVSQRPDEYLLVETADDIDRARATGRLGVNFDIEGGVALDEKLPLVQLYYDLGVRWMSIAYNRNNALGGGCQDNDTGLTKFGREVLDEMARVGMVPCCSHTGFRTTMDVMQAAAGPVIFSHSNPTRVWDHKRNIADEAIRACAQTGGVVGINGIGMFLGPNDASTEAFARHVAYVADLVGPEHVGIGLDYVFDQVEMNDYIAAHPELYPPAEGYTQGIRMVEPERLPYIVDALIAHGFDDDSIRMAIGGNHLRIARQVWKAPHARQAIATASALRAGAENQVLAQ